MPTLTVIAGPNGSGKSTLTRVLWFKGSDRLLDPDAVARELNPENPSAASILAAREVLKRTADYLKESASFAVETTLPRIRARVARGGHLISEADVRRRFFRSAANASAALLLADEAKFYDNSGSDARLLLVARAGAVVWRQEILPDWLRGAY